MTPVVTTRRCTWFAALLFATAAACGGKSKSSETTPQSLPPEETASSGKTLKVSLAAKSESTLTGDAELTQRDDGVEIVVHVAGIAPGAHGVHVHEKADCSSPDGKSAGDHFNPTSMDHGMPDMPAHHLGDFGNLEVGADGTGSLTMFVKGASLEKDAAGSLIGRGLVVHADPDDGKTQPSGNSGKRIGCGEINE